MEMNSVRKKPTLSEEVYNQFYIHCFTRVTHRFHLKEGSFTELSSKEKLLHERHTAFFIRSLTKEESNSFIDACLSENAQQTIKSFILEWDKNLGLKAINIKRIVAEYKIDLAEETDALEKILSGFDASHFFNKRKSFMFKFCRFVYYSGLLPTEYLALPKKDRIIFNEAYFQIFDAIDQRKRSEKLEGRIDLGAILISKEQRSELTHLPWNVQKLLPGIIIIDGFNGLKSLAICKQFKLNFGLSFLNMDNPEFLYKDLIGMGNFKMLEKK